MLLSQDLQLFLLTKLYNKPNLNIDIIPPGPNSTIIGLEVTNSGTVPATNLSLLLTGSKR